LDYAWDWHQIENNWSHEVGDAAGQYKMDVQTAEQGYDLACAVVTADRARSITTGNAWADREASRVGQADHERR